MFKIAEGLYLSYKIPEIVVVRTFWASESSGTCGTGSG